MKKILVIVIMVVYISSIAIVNFFGLETKVFDGITYVTEIQCNTITLIRDGNQVTVQPESYLVSGNKAFIFEFIPAPEGNPYTIDNIGTNPNTVQINHEVLPHLADEQGVTFEFDEKANEGIAVLYKNYFVFLKPNKGITVTVKAKDGSNISTQIYILGTPAKTNKQTNK
jgi:hypothetical protein